MTYKEFKKKYNGKYTDYDGAFGYQCWDLAERYFTEVLKLPASVLSGCGLVSNMLKGEKYQLMLKYFDVVKTPKQGDVAIWEYGHIAIYDHATDYFFSQNPNPCKVIKITRSGVHYFRLKAKTNPIIVKYYPKYNGKTVSIVDALNSIGVDSSFKFRSKIAKANKITGYVGTPRQNLLMLDKLKHGVLIKP